MVGVVSRMNWVERERDRAIERAVTCRREDYLPGRVAFIHNGISAFAEDGQG